MLMQLYVASAQDISFFHLGTANGLSDNLVHSVVRDKDGLLWIGTGEGLNCYDGYSVKKFYTEDHPELGSNQLLGIVCDEKNRLWIRNANGKVTLIDEKRNFKKIPVMDGGKEVSASFIRQTKSRGILLFSGSKLYTLSKNGLSFERVVWKEDPALHKNYSQIVSNENDILLLTGSDRICIFDAVRLQVLQTISLPGIIGAAWLNTDELIVTTGQNRQLFKVSISQKKITGSYGHLTDQYGQPINGYLRHIRRMNDGRFIMTSGYGGVYVFDAVAKKIYRYQHDPLDNRSVSANNTFYVQTDTSGYVYITTRSAGLNYFNTNYQLATYRSSFQESSTGKIFHGFVNFITRHSNGNFWMGTQSRLVEWDREKNLVYFHDYGSVNGVPLNGIEEVRTICFDNEDRLWAGLNRYGIVVLDKNRKVIKYMPGDSSASPNSIPGNFVNRIVLAPDNKLWVATASGLCFIDPASQRVIGFEDLPALKQLAKTYCYNIWFRTADEVWIATNQGAYKYTISQNELLLFNTSNGLPGNTAICFIDDDKGNVYAGTSSGFAVIKENKVVRSYRRTNGLRSDRCQGFIKDASGCIWIGNDNALICYKPSDSSFTAFDESFGLSPSGFRLLSFYGDASGEQFWGSDEGISYFLPGKMQQLEFPLRVNINSLKAGGLDYPFSSADDISIPYVKNTVQFGFSVTDLFGSKNILFEYKLTGADADWKRTNSPQQVSYSKLDPGQYTFLVRASRDGMNWTKAAHPVHIYIITPWWRSWWFITGCTLLCTGAIALSLHNRNKKIAQQKEQLETEKAINYFATSISEQKTVDDILGDVTRNCISRLNFEDCVVYMKDEERNVLVQKAAWGPKTTDGPKGKILNPLDIPLGKGIVGTVALTGIAEIIPDTSKDSRYIIDDKLRYSEIAVPVIYNGTVIGVIDSEHPRKNFFTSKHLSILTTIAALCANKIVRSQAEEEKQKAQLELLQHQRKMAEAQLKSLRLQMSPHFLFNALNSIQQIILSANDAAATKYLSKFSKLLRMVLQHSDREKIPLKEEIETLSLYLELESLRFDDSFIYKINAGTGMDLDEIKIPTLLVQPFVENAIWHGLLHLPGGHDRKRRLTIDFSEDNNDNLICIIEDNGIGRDASKKNGSQDSHTGKGLSVAEERVKTFNEQNIRKSYFVIEDVLDEEGKINGTRVKISLPLIKETI